METLKRKNRPRRAQNDESTTAQNDLLAHATEAERTLLEQTSDDLGHGSRKRRIIARIKQRV